MELPFNAAADRNKEVIGDALSEYLAQATTVLEIGSGSGQHAVYLCQRFSHLQWQVTDQSSYLEGLAAVVEQSGCENIQPPTELQAGACVETGNRVYSFGYLRSALCSRPFTARNKQYMYEFNTCAYY